MKKFLISFLSLTVGFIFLFLACTKEEVTVNSDFRSEPSQVVESQEKVPSNPSYEGLVKDYNQKLIENFGLNISPIQKAFLLESSLNSNFIQSENGLALVIDVNSQLKLEVGLDEMIAFPDRVKNAQVVFLGNHLIVDILDTKEVFNFFVTRDGITNKIPWIKSSIDSRSIGIEMAAKGKKLKARGGCNCYCQRCGFLSDCASLHCSCTSSCGGCSKTCRDGFDAVCVDRCIEY